MQGGYRVSRCVRYRRKRKTADAKLAGRGAKMAFVGCMMQGGRYMIVGKYVAQNTQEGEMVVGQHVEFIQSSVVRQRGDKGGVACVARTGQVLEV